MIDIFADDDIHQESWACDSFIDGAVRHGSSVDAIVRAVGTGIFGSDILVNEKYDGFVFEFFGDLFADFIFFGAAAGTAFLGFRYVEDMLLSMEIIRNRLTAMTFLWFPAIIGNGFFRLGKPGDICSTAAARQSKDFHISVGR